MDDESSVIAEKAKAWQFSYNNKQSEKTASAVKRSMAFLRSHAVKFPTGYIASSEAQLAVLAIRVSDKFYQAEEQLQKSVDDLIHCIVSEFPLNA